MENEKGIVKLTRKQLYDDIWALSVAGVARKYNLNYGKLIATCKVENISFPSSGYWTKKNMGKDVSNEIVEFSGLEDTEISLITKDAVVKRIRKAKAEVVEKVHTDVTEELDVVTEEDLPQKKTDNIPEWPDEILDHLDETERNKVLEYACNLQISQSTRLHKMLVQYKKDIADYKSKLKEVQSRPYYNSRHNKPENEPEFFKEMSDECMSRAIAILDTVFKTIESLGGSINSVLLDEKNELHNRTMHISGRFAEVDIESGEVDIESTKVDIRNKLLSFSDTISEKTINHTVEIFSKCGKENCFGRTIVEKITGLKPSGASKLIKLLVDSEVIVPVTGHGKGKYRFQ